MEKVRKLWQMVLEKRAHGCLALYKAIAWSLDQIISLNYVTFRKADILIVFMFHHYDQIDFFIFFALNTKLFNYFINLNKYINITKLGENKIIFNRPIQTN
jgi:hypothetical protein